MTTLYQQFDDLINATIELKKIQVVKDYLSTIKKLIELKELIKQWIESWNLECRSTDFYTISESKRANIEAWTIRDLLWEWAEEFIEEKVKLTELKKAITSWKVLLETPLDEFCSFTKSVVVKCPILS